MQNVNEYHQAQPVSPVNKSLQLIWSAKSAAGLQEITKRMILRFLMHGFWCTMLTSMSMWASSKRALSLSGVPGPAGQSQMYFQGVCRLWYDLGFMEGLGLYFRYRVSLICKVI